VYDTIFALAESPLENGVIWAGTDDGLVHLTRDDGKAWRNVTPKELPEWIQVNSIEVSPHEKGTAYIAATRYKFDDFRPYLYKTNDYGKTWTRIDRGIPDGAFTRVIREDQVRRGLLFAGTETGIFVSLDDGASWRPFQRNLPAVPITDLAVKNGDLVVATQGRSFWILDDLTPLRLWDDRLAAADAHLFPPRPTPRFPVWGGWDDDAMSQRGVGKNMPPGVIVDFWLKGKPKKGEAVTLEVLSGDKVIHSRTSEKKEVEGDAKEAPEEEGVGGPLGKPLELKEGLNRVVWDMTVLKSTIPPKTVFSEGDKIPRKVAPGTYRVRLAAGGRTLVETFEIRPNPMSSATQEDVRAQFDLLEAIGNDLSTLHETLLKIRDVRAQIQDLGGRAKRLGRGDDLEKRAAALAEKLTTVELELTNPEIKADEDDLNFEPKLDRDFSYLAGMVSVADVKPTAGSLGVYRELKGKLDASVARFEALLAGDVAGFSRAIEELKLPRVVPAPKVEP
jgi:hypothetical protein